jgi:tRNA(Leu) C34 or U34 (ribose-2'-O)-methylase TrmL
MAARINLANVAIVLVQPNISENIGAAARAMCNMGLRRLLVVAPPRCDLTRVCKMATHAALDVVEAMEIYPGLPEALKDFSYVVGTTARLGGERQVVRTPARLAESLLPIAAENPVAVLFGPEDRGLTNILRGIQDGQKRRLRYHHLPDHFHAFFAALLLFEQFSFTGDVAAVALGGHVLAERGHRLARDDVAADGALDSDFEHLPRNFLLQLFAGHPGALDGPIPVNQLGEGVHPLAVDQDVQLDEVGGAVSSSS